MSAGTATGEPGDLARIEMGKFLQTDAEELQLARKKAIEAHHNDIKAAGAEVELAVRKVLARRIPAAFRVSHGHVVDAGLRVSPQLDAVVSDAFHTPILAELEDGTQYVPYESVFAIGEIKSSYNFSKHYVEAFAETIERIRTGLVRQETTANYLGPGVVLGGGLSLAGVPSLRNPLLSFMIFVHSGDFDPSRVQALLSSKPRAALPNVICLLDKGVVVSMRVLQSGDGKVSPGAFSLWPELEVKETPSGTLSWVFLPFGQDEIRPGASLGFLYGFLTRHLNSCVLTHADPLTYLARLFTVEAGPVICPVV